MDSRSRGRHGYPELGHGQEPDKDVCDEFPAGEVLSEEDIAQSRMDDDGGRPTPAPTVGKKD